MFRDWLVRLRPRDDAHYVSQGRTVLCTGRDGFLAGSDAYGLLVYETRLISRYRYLIDGRPPRPVALSNIEQHSWLGYYIALPPGIETGEKDKGSGQLGHASQQTLELRLSRFVGDGLHEDVDLTNFTQQKTAFTLALEVDADFADLNETEGDRQQQGDIRSEWREAGEGAWELVFDYKAEHQYDHQGDTGSARIHRGVTLRVEHSTSAPSYKDGRISFPVELPPHGVWHACINLIPFIDGRTLPPLYGCHAFDNTHNEYDRRRHIFLSEATTFTTPESYTLSHVVVGALERAKRDLAALRLYDLDGGERVWTMAAGLPIYIALFGRDTLTAAWQGALASADMMPGTLAELARWQGREVNDWRDEQPGRMLHEAHTGPLEMLNF
ncbi:MAG TPA: glycogen debranching N-terminal domain-containing protein, partial [Blastocatellia bacterium]|nr:glycogen debranching N-terminal domain-containing protein [Blastocatellia bacterium]